jgi:hypothetical protein
VEQAVDETLSFLYRASPAVVPELIKEGEQGLLKFFQTEPMLRGVTVNARLVEFIKTFVAEAKEAEAARLAGVTAPAETDPAKKPN